MFAERPRNIHFYMYPNTKHLPSASVYVPGPLLFLFLLNLLLLFLWLSPLPWFPLRLFSKFYSSCSLTVCVPILFIPLRSITYKLLAATVLCSYFRSPSSSCLSFRTVHHTDTNKDLIIYAATPLN
jgi:hypothetical protein